MVKFIFKTGIWLGYALVGALLLCQASLTFAAYGGPDPLNYWDGVWMTAVAMLAMDGYVFYRELLNAVDEA